MAADLSNAVEGKMKEDAAIAGSSGAYAQAFALFNCAIAAATLAGPVLARWLSQQYGWATMSLVLGIVAFSGAIPSVSSFGLLGLTWLTGFDSSFLRADGFSISGEKRPAADVAKVRVFFWWPESNIIRMRVGPWRSLATHDILYTSNRK